MRAFGISSQSRGLLLWGETKRATMAKHKYLASEEIVDYICSVSTPEHPVLKKCREETASLPMARMQLGPEQGPLFRILLHMLQAKKTLEVGVFTGYSSTLAALELPSD